jgi:hypothetical protein
MDTEPGVFPAAHLLDDLLRDAALCQQKCEDLMLPKLEERLLIGNCFSSMTDRKLLFLDAAKIC